MITLSEALSNFSGTTNYVAKYTPTGNVLGISQIFDNGTNVGIGTSTPTSKLQIVGTDSTSSNYSLKIDNSASSPLLYVRNDGNIDIGYVNSYGGTSLSYIKNSGFNGAFYINGNIGNGLNNGKQVYINSEFVRLGTQSQSVFGQGTTYIEMQVFDDSSNLRINKSTYDLYSTYTSLGVAYKEGSGAVISATVSSFIYNRILNFNDINNRTLNGININTSLGSWNNIGVGKSTNIGLNVLVGNADINYAAILNGGNVGIGTSTPTSKLQIVGSDSTSSNYSLKIDNSASSPLLYVRNDGNVYSHGFGGISSNAAFGLDSLIAVSGLYNSAFGTNSLKANSTGIGNCAFGFESLKVNTSGNYSTSMGTQALYSNITGASNTAIGNAAMALNVSGATNTAIGKSALYNSTNSGNTAIGNQSLQALSTGSNNTAIGNQSGLNATGSGNVFIGYLAGASETGSNKFFIDNQARTNEATARVESLIYGIFAGLPVNQYLRFNANVGVGVDATAKLHVQGIDTTSGNYALKVDNSASSPLFYVRNDGVILANNLPTSASGLPSGAIWNNGGILNII